MFDKSIIASNFNRFAKNYHEEAYLQKIVAKDLFKISENHIKTSKNIIDLGSGSGFLKNNLIKENILIDKKLHQLDIAKNMFEENKASSNIFNITGDIEDIPLESNIFDLAYSSLAFQWLSDLSKAFSEIKRVLKPSSPLVFSVFCDGTLFELKKSSKLSNVSISVNDFIKLSELRSILSKNFNNFEIITKNYQLSYDDIFELLRSMKSIGASYSQAKAQKKLLNKRDFELLNSFYLKNFRSNGKLVCSWKIAYVICN